MCAVKLQSESVMAVKFSTEEVLDLLVTVDNDLGVSDSESSKEERKGIYTAENVV